jgi:hypothetical protein
MLMALLSYCQVNLTVRETSVQLLSTTAQPADDSDDDDAMSVTTGVDAAVWRRRLAATSDGVLP